MSETPFVVPGWNPLGDAPARTDAAIFELLTAAVFQARFRPEIVRRRWPAIRLAFAGFNVSQVEDNRSAVLHGACERRCRVLDLEQDLR